MSRRSVSLVALLAAAPLAYTPAAAQGVELDEVVLSASRLPQDAKRSGVSVSVVTAADLEKAGNVQLSDYLARLPGISIVQNGGFGTRTDLRVRGLSPRYTAVFIDGIRVDDPYDIAPSFDFGSLGTADIERVEILRGSQSALWGGSAVAGVINITTRTATKDGLSQSAAIEGGSYGTVGARYTLGYRDARVETSFTLSHRRTKGFSTMDTLPPTPGFEKDGAEATRLSFGTRYNVSDSFTVGVNGFVQRSRADYDGIDAFWANDPNVASEGRRREWGGRVFAEYRTDRSTHVFALSNYRISRDDWDANAAGGAGVLSNFTGQRSGFSYQGTTEFSQAFTLVYGAESTRESGRISALPAGGSTRVNGVFVQGLWRPMDNLDLSGALRYDNNSRFGSQPSGRLAVAWQVAPGVTLRGAASAGFRSPSLYELFGDPGNGIAANLGLTPEKSRSFELGADYQLAGGASLGVTLFRVNVDNWINYCWGCGAGGASIYQNAAARLTSQGVELAGKLPLGDRAELGLSYTYTDARTATGAVAPRVPRHALTLSLDGQITERLSGSAVLRHVAGRPSDFNGFAGMNVPMADYTLVNLGVSYKLADNANLSLRIENLLDRKYQTAGGYAQPGRGVYLGLNTSF